jgi:hypothetical protein
MEAQDDLFCQSFLHHAMRHYRKLFLPGLNDQLELTGGVASGVKNKEKAANEFESDQDQPGPGDGFMGRGSRRATRL